MRQWKLQKEAKKQFGANLKKFSNSWIYPLKLGDAAKNQE